MFPNLQDLQSQIGLKAAYLSDLLNTAEKAGRVLTADEQASFDKAKDEMENLERQVTDVQATLDRQAQLASLQDKYKQAPGRVTTPEKPGRVPANPADNGEPYRRGGTLKAFKGARAEERAYRAGVWCRAVIWKDPRAMRKASEMGLLNGEIYNALSTNVQIDGGVIVPEELSQTIIDLRETYGVFRQNVRVVPMGRDTMVIPRRRGGVTIAGIGENPSSAISQSNPTWNDVRITAKKAGGLTLMSSEVAEDAFIDLADWVADEFAYAFAKFEDQCGFTGDGTSTYLGIRGVTDILKAGQSLAGAVDAAAGHDTFAEIDQTDLSTLMAKLPAYARMNAKWYCSTVALDLVFGRLSANAGGNTIQTLQGSYGNSFLGYPIVISQVLPTSTGDLSDVAMFLFGDLSKAATMGDRRDVRVFPSEHRYMDTDQIGIRATARFDIVVHDYGDATDAGPIVALVGE